MGREFELKYAATEADLEVLKARYPGLRPIAMETTYYDNEAGDFSRLKWTFRRRMENGKSICTLKTPGDGLVRNEWEVACHRIEDAVSELCKLGAPVELIQLCKNGLVISCGAKFTRRAGTFTLRDCVFELALDEGTLLGGSKELPLCELEAELKEGNPEAMETFACELAGIYGLQPEGKSKFARALALKEEG